MTTRPSAQGPRVAVIGAGAFGGWAAVELVRRGARVALVDAWGPGHVRASSGGETRVLRAAYGTRTIYTAMAARASELWRAHDRRWPQQLFRETGGLWMFGADDHFGRSSADALDAEGVPFEWLTPADTARRFPQVSTTGLASVIWEPGAGYLHARRACAHVVDRVVADGGTYRRGAVTSPVSFDHDRPTSMALADGTTLTADLFVFACGPWLGSLFPDVVGDRVTSTRQEVHYFGTPAGDGRYLDEQCPVWIDFRDRVFYGIPGNVSHGFKLADDTSGPRFDPTSGSRDLDQARVAASRTFLRERFPGLADAPFVGGEVCQYEASPDSHFIVDTHPAADNVWIVGGGSGHGFKMGPVMGEIVAAAVLGQAPPDPVFRLARLKDTPGRPGGPSSEDKWL